MAFVLTPAAPITGWLAELDKWTRNSPDFFVGRPIILDLATVALNQSEIGELIEALGQRGIRIMGLEGVDPNRSTPRCHLSSRADDPWPPARRLRPPSDQPAADAAAAATSGAEFLAAREPIRSGQSVIFPYGDVTVLGSVASGAEIVAGGSIHVYGALRGRAMAGPMGNGRARIFCSKNEAELISIDGYYRTAEEMDASLRGRPAQCWLQDRVLSIAALD